MNVRFWMCGALAAALLASPGCGDKDSEKPKEAPKAATETPKQPEPPKEVTAEQTAQIVKDCWAAFAAKDEAKMKACYAADATFVSVGAAPPMEATGQDGVMEMINMYWAAFPDMKAQPQLTLVNGDKAAVVAWTHGTNTGPFGPMPATGKEAGLLEGQYLQFTKDGKVKLDEHYADDVTLMAQLGIIPIPHAPVMTEGWDNQETVIAKNDETEKANVELIQSVEFGKANRDKLLEMYADDAVFHYVGETKGPTEGKEAITKGMDEFFAMSSDVTAKPVEVWGAGDYVVAVVTMSGTMDGKLPKEMAAAKGKSFEQKELEIFKIEDGKIKKHWIFANNAGMMAQMGMMPEPPAGGGEPAKDEAPKKG